jgi:ribonucrease Y
MELEIILFSVHSAIIASVISLYISKKLNDAKFDIYVEQARAKSISIEHKAEALLKDAKIKAKETYEKEYRNAKKDCDNMFYNVERKEEGLALKIESELKKIDEKKNLIEKEKKHIKLLKEKLEFEEKTYKEKNAKALKILENGSGLTQDEAKEIILEQIKEKSRADIASIFRKEYKVSQKQQKEKILNLLAVATSRYAGDFAAERLVAIVKLPNTDIKGKIIGKEGRNIKALEMCLGVDIIIDDTPDQITVSSFNLYRRAVATKALNLLIEDGRIQPTKIEETCSRVRDDFDKNILEEGKDTLLDLGIENMDDHLVSLIGKLRYRASYGQNALAHTLEVANLAGLIAGELGGNQILARRAGILHDIGKALTHEVKGSHVDIGVDLCKKYNEPKEVINAIYAHHGHEEALSIESAAVCAADALSAARPGARREVLENYLKRVEEIENICMANIGVSKAYAINAGREVRIIVKAELVNDDESILLATNIASKIEEKVNYPGEIKVSVIRELRAIEYAR